jgi:hypothetical protein
MSGAPAHHDDTAADHASQVMSESGSVEVLSAEVRVLQVGDRQLTRSMYRQLDEASPERFEPFGRVKDNKRRPKDGWRLAGRDSETGVLLVGRDSESGALVRCHAQPPDWSELEGPEEFTHWMKHWAQASGNFITYHRGYPVTKYQGFAIRWRVSYKDVCAAPEAWHVRDKTPEAVRQLDRVRQLEMRQQRCTVDLDQLERQWREKANREMTEMLAAQARYDGFKALPLIVFAGLK